MVEESELGVRRSLETCDGSLSSQPQCLKVSEPIHAGTGRGMSGF